jgi:hypothetical protein
MFFHRLNFLVQFYDANIGFEFKPSVKQSLSLSKLYLKNGRKMAQ